MSVETKGAAAGACVCTKSLWVGVVLALDVSFLDKTLSANHTFFCSLRRVSVKQGHKYRHKIHKTAAAMIMWIDNEFDNKLKVVLFLLIPTVYESSVTRDTDPTLFSTQVSQPEPQITADHTEHLQIKANTRSWTLCDPDQPSSPQLTSIMHIT